MKSNQSVALTATRPADLFDFLSLSPRWLLHNSAIPNQTPPFCAERPPAKSEGEQAPKPARSILVQILSCKFHLGPPNNRPTTIERRQRSSFLNWRRVIYDMRGIHITCVRYLKRGLHIRRVDRNPVCLHAQNLAH